MTSMNLTATRPITPAGGTSTPVRPPTKSSTMVQPFLDDLARRAKLGFAAAATEIATGVLCGLCGCREAGSETLLECTPDYAAERAGALIGECSRLGVVLPVDDLLDRLPDWDGLLDTAMNGRRT